MNKFKSTRKRKFFTDGSHGWLKVSKKELEKYGIEKDISSFSFMKGEYAYLEEDSDLSLFVKALRDSDGVKEGTPEYKEHAIEYFQNITVSDTSRTRRSAIRGYERYEYRDAKEIARIEAMRSVLMGLKNWNKQGIRMIKNGHKSDLEFWMEHYGLNRNVLFVTI